MMTSPSYKTLVVFFFTGFFSTAFETTEEDADCTYIIWSLCPYTATY